MFFGWPTLHFRRAKVGVCIRCSSVLKIQARKCYIESLSLVAEDKKAAFLKVKGPLYSCLLIAHLPSGSRMLNWHLETIAFFSCDYISSTDHQTHTQIASFPGSPWEQGHTQALWQKCNGAWENPARRHTGDVMIQPLSFPFLSNTSWDYTRSMFLWQPLTFPILVYTLWEWDKNERLQSCNIQSNKAKTIDTITTVDRKIFALKIIHVLNFHVKNISPLDDSTMQHVYFSRI